MNRKLWGVGLLFLALFFSNVSGGVKNLVKNGSFEVDKDNNGIPDNWRFVNSGGEKGSKGIGILDSALFHSGNYSGKIEKLNDKVCSSWTTTIPVKPLTKYRLSVWYRTEREGIYLGIGICCKDREGKVIYYKGFGFNGTNDWKLFERIFDTEKGTEFVEIQLKIYRKGIAWFDDASLVEIAPARIRSFSKQTELIEVSPDKAKMLLERAISISKKIYVGHQKTVKDETAKDGYCVRIDGAAPPYFAVSYRPDINEIIPGFKYTFYGRIKIRKKGEEGTAFRIGVYDEKNKRYVAKDMRPKTKDVENMKWKIYKIGTFEFQPGQLIYVGPTNNVKNIPEIFVDYFFVLPGDENCEKFYKNSKEKIKFYLRTEKEGYIGLKIKERKVSIGYLITDDKRVFENSLIGVIIDYKTEDKFKKRVVLSLGICGEKIKEGNDINLGYGKNVIDKIVKVSSLENLGKYNKLEINLEDYAPDNWDGETWFTLINRNTLNTFSGSIIKPEKEKMNIFALEVKKGKNDFVGLDMKSLNYLSEKAKNTVFKSKIEKLKNSITRRKK